MSEEKIKLSERDICTKYITPAIIKSGWDKKFREEVSFTDGKVIVRGNLLTRGKKHRADYLLYYKNNLPIAVLEAKDNNHSIDSGIQQALRYAEALDIPFAFSSNGDAFLFHDKTITEGEIEKELTLDEFPTPQELWEKYKKWKNIEDSIEEIITQDYYSDIKGKKPRYYQEIAINKTVQAIANGQNRILLVLATGTGKTLVASQIIWILWKSKKKKRILFLADRNILVDQTMANDFKMFEGKMTKIKNRTIDKAFEIYLALYQGLTGSEDLKNIYKEFSPDFFDLILIDECHRGSAAEDSAWREILEYFSSASQVGLTATPKETKDISNITYFGEPIYTYSLKQGIDDGFLAPYKVIRLLFDKDVYGWRPTKTTVDIKGNSVEDRVYNAKDYDKNLVLLDRSERVAKKITEYLKKTDRFSKTIVFCVDIEHAERMRRCLANENADLVSKNHKYIMRITGDNEEGKKELSNFIDPESKYPVIVTTSKLMTTGVDAQTCKLIVLDSNINSMTEFKQIIGRGTRIKEDSNKLYFTIIDFRNVTNLFADPNFDGDPVVIYEPKEEDDILPPDDTPDSEDSIPSDEEIISRPYFTGQSKKEKTQKIYVRDVSVEIINERIQYYGSDGKLTTESLKDYTKKAILEEYSSLDNFLRKWNSYEKKQEIINELIKQNLLLSDLETEIKKDLDPFDLICHIAFEQPALSKKERAEKVKKRNYFTKYGEKARLVLEALLDKYSDEGIESIETLDILNIRPFNSMGSPIEIIKFFGDRKKYIEALKELEDNIYSIG